MSKQGPIRWSRMLQQKETTGQKHHAAVFHVFHDCRFQVALSSPSQINTQGAPSVRTCRIAPASEVISRFIATHFLSLRVPLNTFSVSHESLGKNATEKTMKDGGRVKPALDSRFASQKLFPVAFIRKNNKRRQVVRFYVRSRWRQR